MLDGAFIWASCGLRSGIFWVSWWHSLWFSEAEIWGFFQQCWVFAVLAWFWDWLSGLCKVVILKLWKLWSLRLGGSLKCRGWFIEDCGMKSLIKGWTFWGVWVRLIGCEWGWNWLCFVVKPVSVEDSEVGVWGLLWFALHEFKAYCFCKVVHQVFSFSGIWMEFCLVKI